MMETTDNGFKIMLSVFPPGIWMPSHVFVMAVGNILKMCKVDWKDGNDLATCLKKMADLGVIEVAQQVNEKSGDINEEIFFRLKEEMYLS